MVISKSIGKKRQSTRKLAKRLTKAGYAISQTSVCKHLKTVVGAKAYKPRKEPKLTEKQRKARLKFARDRKGWTIEDWKCVLWSDESPFHIFHLPNSKNDIIWARNKDDIEPTPVIKHPPGLMVWGMMSHQALSELHIIPPGQMVNARYYVDEILAKTCLDAINRESATGDILTRRMVETPSKAIFMQDGAPSHTSNLAQSWCSENIAHFWKKEAWPGNSPDLNPIKNLWAILQVNVDELAPSTNRKQLEKSLKIGWSKISPEILHNLIAGMPDRMKKCIANKGYFIGK